MGLDQMKERMNEIMALALRREEPGARARAVALLETQLREAPSALAHFVLASLYDDRAETLAQAIAHYRAGLDLEPGDPAARNNLAVALMATGKTAEAVREFSRVLRDQPSYSLAALNLAEAVRGMGDDVLAEVVDSLREAGRTDAVVRLMRAAAEAGRQEAFAEVWAAGHALKNRVGLAGSKAGALARTVPEAKELAEALGRLYADWAAFLKSARGAESRREPCDLNAVAHEVAQGFSEAERPALSLAPQPVRALGDAASLREAVLNLARNARDASPRGRVEMATSLSADGRAARLSVSDDGPGIARADLRRIFAPGFTTKPKGSGFGLSVADRIVRSLGGQIEVTSDPGRGATFTVVLPAATAAPPRLAPRLAAEEFVR
jgi:signal transduction histidine kinase